ncbi:MAG: hypothetical protein IJD40_01110 [Lachnospiraceae bacterium]|nr:hypothetical protein [Lachnospiraceae bacterium]
MLQQIIVMQRRCGKCVLLLLCTLLLFQGKYTYAKSVDLPSDVKVVKNEKVMIRSMVVGMKKHKTQFSYYYEGIYKDFKKYRSISKSYTTFFDKVAREDGYITGIVSGYCITICGTDTKYVTFQFGYLTTKKQERQIDKRVKKIVKRIGKGSNVMRVRRAHDYLINHMSYDENYYNPYHAFVKGKGMCMSYALAFQRILQEMDIPCIYIKGKNHAWNMVKIGKCWYNVDVTWDDRLSGRYRYFLKSDAEFPGHKRPNSKWLSSLKKAKYSYNLSKIH